MSDPLTTKDLWPLVHDWRGLVAIAVCLNFDHVALARRDSIGSVIANIAAARWEEAERALLICGFAEHSAER